MLPLPRPLLLLLLASASFGQVQLSVDTEAISLVSGSAQTLRLDAGVSRAGQPYFIVGSASGTTPGQNIGGFNVPLNPGPYFDFSLSNPNNAFLPTSFGLLDGVGRAVSLLSVPINDPSLYGVQIDHLFVSFDAVGLTLVSNTVPVTLAENVLTLTSPSPGSTVGTSVIDVRGTLGSTLSGTAGVTVMVGGVGAQITTVPGGIGRFVALDVPVVAGGNLVQITAQNAAGHVERVELSVNQVNQSANNVVVDQGYAYLARGAAGLGALELESREVALASPVAGMGSVDDVCVANGFLFALDASGAGALAVFDLADPHNPVLVSGPVSVPVSPFAGVSAANGRVVVSGGTSLMTQRSYSLTSGVLGSAVSTIDLGIGQPDVLLSANGSRAFVSTDFAGTFGGFGFGITVAQLSNPPVAPSIQSRVGLAGAGFTAGFAAPANFPIESALLPGSRFVTAHGGGITVIDGLTGQALSALSVGFPAVNVDTDGDVAFVVGSGRLAEVDLSSPNAPVILSNQILGGAFTGVAANPEFVVIAANAGGVVVRRR